MFFHKRVKKAPTPFQSFASSNLVKPFHSLGFTFITRTLYQMMIRKFCIVSFYLFVHFSLLHYHSSWSHSNISEAQKPDCFLWHKSLQWCLWASEVLILFAAAADARQHLFMWLFCMRAAETCLNNDKLVHLVTARKKKKTQHATQLTDQFPLCRQSYPFGPLNLCHSSCELYRNRTIRGKSTMNCKL